MPKITTDISGLQSTQTDIKTAVESIDTNVTKCDTDDVTVTGSTLPAGAATEATLADVKTAVEIIDNFISGTRGLVTEDNSADIKTAVEAINSAFSSIFADVYENTWTQLTATGATAASDSIIDYNHHTIQYVVASIDTTVVVRAEGSLDGTSWFNLNAAEEDTTIDTDGTNSMTFEGRIKYARFNFVSETGGTNATIDAKILSGV